MNPLGLAWVYLRLAAFLVVCPPALAQQEELHKFLERLTHSDARVREAAALDVGRLGVHAERAIPALAEALRYSGENDVPRNAAWALGQIGSAAVPVLIGALQRHEELARAPIIDALTEIGAPAVAPLAEQLHGSDAFVRAAAAEALGGMGGRARAAVPALIQASLDRDTQETAIMALGRIGVAEPDVVPTLIDHVRQGDRSARHAAVIALGQLGADAVAAVPTLVEQLDQKQDGAFLASVARALGALGPAASEALPRLMALRDHPNKFVRSQVRSAIAAIH